MWYDTSIMLNTTFTTYKEKFGEIFLVLKPLIVIQFSIGIAGILGAAGTVAQNWIYIIIASIVTIVLSFMQAFVYTPATFRTLQKREFGEVTTIEDGVAFQKVNKWKFFITSLWAGLYSLGYALMSFIPFLLGVFFSGILFDKGGVAYIVVASLFLIAGCWSALYLLYKNFTKVFFALNVYFAKDLEPLENVQESIRLGEKYRKTIWGNIGGVFAINLIGMFIVILPYIFNIDVFMKKVEPSLLFTSLTSLLQIAVGILFIAPMTYMYMSRAYKVLVERDSAVAAEIVQ
jgi:hypothetical protein